MPYTTAKAALTAFGKALDMEIGPQGVRVNTVSPGPVRTSMWEAADGHGAAMAEALGVPSTSCSTSSSTSSSPKRA